MQYEGLEFEVKLESISANIKRTKSDVPYTVYNLNFVKEIDKDIDLKLAQFVKYKEEDVETGKKTVKYFSVEMDSKE